MLERLLIIAIYSNSKPNMALSKIKKKITHHFKLIYHCFVYTGYHGNFEDGKYNNWRYEKGHERC